MRFKDWTYRVGVLLSLALLPLLGGGCANDSRVISQANEFDKGLEPAVINDRDVDDYLQSIGDRIIAAAKELDAEHFGPKSHFSSDSSWMFTDAVKFHLVNSKTLNAFTTGGEHVYIYNELLQLCNDEGDLSAVMSHEYGHIYARHVHKGMNRQVALMLGAGAAGVAGYAVGGKEHGQEYAGYGAGAGALVGQFVNMGFTREDESQADNLGIHFYTRAGYDPNHFADFFQTMIDKGYDKTPAYMSDHPTLASRVEASKKAAKKLDSDYEKDRRPPIASPDRFRALKERAAEIARRTPDDKSLANTQQLLQALPRSCLTTEPPSDQKQAQDELLRKAEKPGAQEKDQPRRRQRARSDEAY